VSYEVDLVHGETVSLPFNTFWLEVLPVRLAAVVVEGERATRRPMEEFRERRAKAGTGAFVTRDEFEKQGDPQNATDVLRRMQGIRLVPWVRSGTGFVESRRWMVMMQRGGARSFGTPSESNPCPPLFLLDGHYLGNDNTISIDLIMPLVNVDAIEAYGPAASLPPEFNRSGSECGVILFWTR
jgi:hypothetical protein